MSDSSTDPRTEAIEIANLSLRVFPVRGGDKRPSVMSWPEVATTSQAQIEEWFVGDLNLGLRCGATDSTAEFFVVDIDIKNDQPGKESWADFCTAHPEVEQASRTTWLARTPSGGWHFYFAVPEGWECPRNGRPFPGVDIRGEGGYVLAPPSKINGKFYEWVRSPWDTVMAAAPPALLEALLPEPEPQSVPVAVIEGGVIGHNVVRIDGDSPKDWAKQNFGLYDWLLRQGWQSGRRKGDEEEMTRPGKSRREGTSATFHHDSNIVNIYTTTVDPDWEALGFRSRNGVITLNGFDGWMIENGYRDAASAMGELRRSVMPASPGPGYRVANPSPASATEEAGPGPEESHAGDLNLPDEFWESRDTLAHIRQAAWAMKCSPDAVLASVLTRYAADVHPSIMLPEWGTLDLFTVIAGHSGGYKSKASKTARQLYPGRGDAAVMHDHNVGSGEAVAEVFFEWVDEEGRPCGPNKKDARKVQTKWGLHFATDEGTALVASAGRMGSILIPTLCAAWMGEAIGQALADPTKSRMIKPFAVRVTAEVKVQTIHGYKLFDEAYASTGLSQRMVCFSSIDPTVRARHEAGEAPPPWPGQLTLPYPFVLADKSARIMEIAPTIARALDDAAAGGHDYDFQGSPLDTHSNLSQLKLAALLALWEDRFLIEDADWDLAGMIMDTHRAVRSRLWETRTQAKRNEGYTRNLAEAERAVVVDDAKHKAILRRTLSVLEARLEADKPLGKKYVSGPQRHVYEEAMTILEAQGRVREDKGGWVKA